MIESRGEITQTYLNAIEKELKLALIQAAPLGNNSLYEMLSYHMGWPDTLAGSLVKGKRIRPFLTLLSCSALGGDWNVALPAAAAVELVHNFSLIHDDIEDHSFLRRGRPTVYKKWGIAQAINAGDAMFTLAHLQTIRLREKIPAIAALRSVEVLQQACLHLTQGQYLDLAFEKRNEVSIDEYWNMVDGKTAALISACTELGAICANADEQTIEHYRNFGRLFGLAFQVIDDLLGVWGNMQTTGKSNQSDLSSGKKTLPILYGLSRQGKFSELWWKKTFQPEDIEAMTELLDQEGGKEFTMNTAKEIIRQAITVLEKTNPLGNSGEILRDLAMSLTTRDS